jgi:hypothetical protein
MKSSGVAARLRDLGAKGRISRLTRVRACGGGLAESLDGGWGQTQDDCRRDGPSGLTVLARRRKMRRVRANSADVRCQPCVIVSDSVEVEACDWRTEGWSRLVVQSASSYQTI